MTDTQSQLTYLSRVWVCCDGAVQGGVLSTLTRMARTHTEAWLMPRSEMITYDGALQVDLTWETRERDIKLAVEADGEHAHMHTHACMHACMSIHAWTHTSTQMYVCLYVSRSQRAWYVFVCMMCVCCHVANSQVLGTLQSMIQLCY